MFYLKQVNKVPYIDDAMSDDELFRMVAEMNADGEEVFCTGTEPDNKGTQPLAS